MNNDHLINGSWETGAGPSITLINPCTGEPRGLIKNSSTEQIERAFTAAQDTFPVWSYTSIDLRIELLENYAEILADKKEELAKAISTDTGKPHWEALTEAGAMIGKIALSISAHHTRCAEFGNAPSKVTFKPHGVITVIGPFNFPGHLPNGHIVPALLAGNTVVYKPSELTPTTAILMVNLLESAGIPAGVINLLQGDGKVGAQLTEHPIPKGVFFTGSSRTGHVIKASNTSNGKILALEMGGNNPLVVTKTDDITATALLIIQSAFLTAGQRCTCARRLILVENESTAELLEKLTSMSAKILIGHPSADPAPFIGPVITSAAALAVIERQQELIALGGKPLLKAKIIVPNTGFVSPAIIDITSCEIPEHETFGPLLQITRVPDLDTAISEANNTAYGLSAGIFASNPEHYQHFKTQINAGIVNWNQQLTGASGAAPFGGVGLSGNHRPSAYFAADYCSYPVASIEQNQIVLPVTLPPGIHI